MKKQTKQNSYSLVGGKFTINKTSLEGEHCYDVQS